MEPVPRNREERRKRTSPEEAAINAIRAKISRSDYAGALTDARKAQKNHPGNGTIKELVTRLKTSPERRRPLRFQ